MAEPEKRGQRPIHINAEAARGGEIILRTRLQRAIFIGGFVAVGLLAIWLGFA